MAGTDQLNIFAKPSRWRPHGFDEKKLTSDEAAVLNYLKGCHVGAKRPIVVRELAGCVGADERKCREILKHLTEEHHVGIAASVVPPYGVFLIDTEEEALDYCAQIHGRAMSMLHREAVIKKITLPELLGQMSIDLTAEAQRTQR